LILLFKEAKSVWVDEDKGGLQMAPKRAATAALPSAATAGDAAKRQRLIRPIGCALFAVV
jgi:hypothetical protein